MTSSNGIVCSVRFPGTFCVGIYVNGIITRKELSNHLQLIWAGCVLNTESAYRCVGATLYDGRYQQPLMVNADRTMAKEACWQNAAVTHLADYFHPE